MDTSHKRKKAFTLTELLVVVIVIGVLSAVVLPKFSKVVETRKTTEAEELMSAVRTEQEKRCALDKSYVTSLTAVKDIVPSGTSKNYAYSLTSTGMEAQSKGKYGYTLKMPSYADGRICCENEAECAKLNKDYPLCSALMARADYRSGAECAGEPEEKECPGSSTQSCGCQGKGTQTRTCSSCHWGEWGECQVTECEYGTRSDGSCRELVMKYRPSSTGTATIPACPVASNPTMTSTDCRNLRCPSSGNTITYTVGSWDTTCDADTGPGHAYTGNVSAVKKEYGGSEWWHCVFTNFECRQDWEVYL